MSWSVTKVADGQQKSSSQTFVLTLTAAVAAGSKIVVGSISAFAGDPTVTDSSGTNTYTLTKGSTGSTRVNLYTAENVAALGIGATITLDVGAGNSATVWAAIAGGITGAASSSSVDANTTNIFTSSGTASPSVASTSPPAVANELFIGFLGTVGPSGDTYTEDTTHGWTQLDRIGTTGGAATGNRTINMSWLVNSGTGSETYAPTITSRNLVQEIISYKPAVMHPLTITATQSSSAALAKSAHASRRAVQAATAAIHRAARSSRIATQATTAKVVKQVAAKRKATQSTSAALSAIRVILITIAASVTSIAVVRKAVAATRRASHATTAKLAKAIHVTRRASQSTVAHLQAIKAILFTITAVQASAAKVVKAVGAAKKATQATSAHLAKAIAVSRKATQPATARVLKLVSWTRRATQASAAAVVASRVLLITLTAIATSAAVVRKAIGSTRRATQGTTVVVRKAITTTRRAAQASTGAVHKLVSITRSATATAIGLLRALLGVPATLGAVTTRHAALNAVATSNGVNYMVQAGDDAVTRLLTHTEIVQ